ncbi:AbrB/MazE/SpoVT family DNA-binding domain-containing protein [Candidatus Bipolaricaulota bacterium]|nr:AbrB/MazE/SpoVT family DNA-binding domain-containing protein [Candidatus Bipolaricaulota bacterium]
MYSRKVQITGGSTFMVTLPKAWAEGIGLEPGTEVNMVSIKPNTMVLQPQTKLEEEDKVGKLKIGDKEGAVLTRSIISLYIAGYEVIKIEGKQITSEQRGTIRKTTQSLIGPEIVEESSNQIIIRNLSDLSELSINETLSRIYQISRTMFEDSVDAMIQSNHELARDVEDRDDDVDRLYLALSRRFRVMLYTIVERDGKEVNRARYFDYQTAAKQLERIADHAKKIASISPALEEDLPEEVKESFNATAVEALSIVDKSVKSLTQRDIDLANEALARGDVIEEDLFDLDKALRKLDPQTAQLLGIVSDSIERVKEYGKNIAETALNSSCPLPGEGAGWGA